MRLTTSYYIKMLTFFELEMSVSIFNLNKVKMKMMDDPMKKFPNETSLLTAMIPS